MWSTFDAAREKLFPTTRHDRNRASRTKRRPRLEALEERQLLSGSVPLSFQFGPPSLQAAPGYTAVSTALYNSSTGYGWASNTGLFTELNYGESSLYPLTSDSVGGHDATFEVAVPNGTYTVTPTLGMLRWGLDPTNVYIDGQQVASRLTAVPYQPISPNYVATVTNGQLDVRFVGVLSSTSNFYLDDLTITQSLAANIGGPYQGFAQQPVHFASSATAPDATDQANLAYSWNFGDGTTASGSSPSHTFAQDGYYTVTLSVTDPEGSLTKATTVVDIYPSVTAANEPTVNAGQSVNFTGTAVGSSALSYLWNFGDGGTATGTLTPTHVYSNPGTYTATLTAIDPDGLSSSATVVMSVADVAPTVTVSVPSSGTAGAAVSFAAVGADISPVVQAAGFTYNWSFGDGTTGTGADPSHAYSAAGTYDVSVNATDTHGKTSMQATGLILIAAATSTININAAWLQQQGGAPLLPDSGRRHLCVADERRCARYGIHRPEQEHHPEPQRLHGHLREHPANHRPQRRLRARVEPDRYSRLECFSSPHRNPGSCHHGHVGKLDVAAQ